ncbi:hypothetical protein AB395_0000514 [Sinorhizobium fredii CCBAU 45436]|nr:hypothetical protein AB395_0000514 [Sinorhizobium fredii CCBAU 45436]
MPSFGTRRRLTPTPRARYRTRGRKTHISPLRFQGICNQTGSTASIPARDIEPAVIETLQQFSCGPVRPRQAVPPVTARRPPMADTQTIDNRNMQKRP